MFKPIFSLLITFGIIALVSSSFFPSFPVTSFLWSGTNYFTTHSQCVVEKTLSVGDLADLVTKISNKQTPIVQNGLWDYARKEAITPEILIVFVEPNSQISHTAYTFLQDTITASSSSVIAPYMYRDSSSAISDILIGAFRLAPNARTIIAADDRNNAIQLDSLLNTLEKDDEIYNNGVVDLVFVYLSADITKTSFITNIDNKIKQATKGNYVAVFTANSEFEREKLSAKRDVVFEERTVQVRDSGTYAQSKYWPHQIWEGLLISALLLILLTIGLWCTFELQTPVRWEKQKVHQN